MLSTLCYKLDPSQANIDNTELSYIILICNSPYNDVDTCHDYVQC